MAQIRQLLTVRQFSERHPAFPEGSLRWHIFRARQNGLDRFGAVQRIGRRVYIDQEKFFEWIDAQQHGRVAP
jgi:hypothetical protein